MKSYFLGLGSNQGERLRNLQQALQEVSMLGILGRKSSVYETEPQYELAQPSFLNMVCQLNSALNVRALFNELKAIERNMGRILTFRNGPRLIDLDVLFSLSESCREVDLQVPHPRLAERAFVLVPLNQIAAHSYLGAYDATIEQLLQRLPQEALAGVRLHSEVDSQGLEKHVA